MRDGIPGDVGGERVQIVIGSEGGGGESCEARRRREGSAEEEAGSGLGVEAPDPEKGAMGKGVGIGMEAGPDLEGVEDFEGEVSGEDVELEVLEFFLRWEEDLPIF